jgi:site-specific DNA recombinase
MRDESQEIPNVEADRDDKDRPTFKSLINELNQPNSRLAAVVRQSFGKPVVAREGALRIAIYVRVSTEEQAQMGGELEGYSIPAQREACLSKVRQLGGVLVEEYVDAGESAKSANRPKLQKMLKELKSHRVDVVVVHKIDRLARNRADDVEINAAIARAGAKLMSVSEPVDETPAGRLLYNMMADVAQYHSDNLAVEVLKGMNGKAKAGGTPFQAPIGYLNHRAFRDGFEIRTIILDPERAPLVRWAFEQYALGDWSLRHLTDVLNDKGLRTRATRKRTSKKLTISGTHHMLRNPYYIGIVPYQGVFHEGKHEPLVKVETWLRVQDVLSTHQTAGEKERKHQHYLKGSVFCGRCGSRLIYSLNRGRAGDRYDYYVCGARLGKRNDCAQKYIRVPKVEVGVEELYSLLHLPEERAEEIRAGVLAELESDRAEAAETKQRAVRRLGEAKMQQEKLLQAHYSGAVPMDLMKSEMARLSREVMEANQAIADATRGVENLEETLRRALEIAQDCARAYADGTPMIRRLMNQGLFERLYINEDGSVERFEMTEPFGTLFDPELLEQLCAERDGAVEAQDIQDSGEEEAPSVLVRMFVCEKRTYAKRPDLSIRPCSNINTLVLPSGFEPPFPP